MPLIPYLAVLAVYLISSAVGGVVARRTGLPPLAGREDTLDGLRGLLAIGVFLCHAFAWYGVIHHEGWHDARIPLFLHLGQSTVAMFFMLTAYLFFGRLLNARERPVDWLHLYVSRVLRLAPAYVLAIVLMIGVVAWVTLLRIDGAGEGIVLRNWSDIAYSVAIWLGFSMLGTPPIDAYMNTSMIVAGVTWSLPFEWVFYCALPLLALPLRVRMPAALLVLGGCDVLWIGAWQPWSRWPYWFFLGGMAAALLARSPAFVRWARGPLASVVVLAVLAAVVAWCPTPFAAIPTVLLTLAFSVLASGNAMFGVLHRAGPRMLGRVAYSIYLLHGLMLYVVFMILVGLHRAAAWPDAVFWSVVVALSAVLVVLASAAFHLVELPGLRAVPHCVAGIRSGRARMALALRRRRSPRA